MAARIFFFFFQKVLERDLGEIFKKVAIIHGNYCINFGC